MKTMKVNEGEVPQYYVENSHEAIIDLPTGTSCKRRLPGARRSVEPTAKQCFSSRLVCGDCGGFFQSKVCSTCLSQGDMALQRQVQRQEMHHSTFGH